MPLLNVNNHSLTSTSECDTRSPIHILSSTASQKKIVPVDFDSAATVFCRFVGRINIYKDKEEPVAR